MINYGVIARSLGMLNSAPYKLDAAISKATPRTGDHVVDDVVRLDLV